ncbi:hypothetical protein AB0I34_06920 [Kribbella sp. NPDC050281]|uniref:hypothetical protein n=1 Tax=Kribbella sp. NPDC050281 TaxID=3155515 RepID=UPI0034066B97
MTTPSDADIFIRTWSIGTQPYNEPTSPAAALYGKAGSVLRNRPADTATQQLQDTLTANPATPPRTFLISPLTGQIATHQHLHQGWCEQVYAWRNPHLLRSKDKTIADHALRTYPVAAWLEPDDWKEDTTDLGCLGSVLITTARVTRLLIAAWLAPVAQQLCDEYATDIEISTSSTALGPVDLVWSPP